MKRHEEPVRTVCPLALEPDVVCLEAFYVQPRAGTRLFVQSCKHTNLLSSWKIFQDMALSSGSLLYVTFSLTIAYK